MSLQLIQEYHHKVQEILQYGGSRNETAIRPAFQKLLEQYCADKKIELILELEYRTALGTVVNPDGTLKDAFRQDWGYWESKDQKDIVSELKGSNTTRKIKEYFYRNLPPAKWKLYTIILNKERVYPQLRSRPGKKKLYNFLARFILERVDMADAGPTVNLVVDRCKNTDEIKDFNAYIVNQLEALLPLNVPLYITHELSQNNPGLQAVDLFCWGLFRKYEWDDASWYQIFKPVIAFEDEYLK